MHETGLSSPERIQVASPDGVVRYGGDQEWYCGYFQRMAGCGPTVASNLLLYHAKGGRISLPVEVRDPDTYRALMDTVWSHVTPNMRGVSTLRHFCGGVRSYLRAIRESLACNALEVPRSRRQRPDLPTLAAFLADAMDADSPVAFLIRSHGDVENLEPWHWVTLVSFAYDADAGTLTGGIYNNAKPARVDLAAWLAAPGFGGGFVYFA